MEQEAKKGKHSRLLTKERYQETLLRLRNLETSTLFRTLACYNLLRRFNLVRVQTGGEIVDMLGKSGTNLCFVPVEDLFDIIHEAHIEKGHAGRDIMLKHIAAKFCNVTTDQIMIYRSFCEKCSLKNLKQEGGLLKTCQANNCKCKKAKQVCNSRCHKASKMCLNHE